MITGMDRLVAAANGQISDRIPVFCILLDQGAKELGMSIEEYYSKGEYVAQGQLQMRQKYGYDNLWSLFYVGKEAELLGCRKIIFAKDGPPNIGEMIIKTYDDIHRLEVPDDISSHPAFAEPLKCMRILKKEAGGKYPICAYITASMTLPAILMGMNEWLELLLNGPVEVRDELLSKCSTFLQRQITAYRNEGVDVMVYSNPFGSTDVISMDIFNKISMPWMHRDLAPLGTKDIVYYCGGARMKTVIEQVIENFGITTFYLSPWDDITQCKSIIAARGMCAGVINDIKLIDWSKQQIRDEVRRIIGEGMAGGKFFFGTLLMPYSIPEANIRTMFEAAYEYGRYL